MKSFEIIDGLKWTEAKSGHYRNRRIGLLHRYLYQKHYNCSILKNIHCHHLDGNPKNNNINNLILLTISEHTKLHRKDYKSTPETNKKISDTKKSQGLKLSESHKAILLKIVTGQKMSNEAKTKMSESKIGNKNPMYGKPGTMLGKKLSNDRKQAMSDLKEKKSVVQIDGNNTKIYKSVCEASRLTGISKGAISNVCRGRAKTAGGFTWRFN